MNTTRTRPIRLTAALGITLLALTGCAPATGSAAGPGSTATESASSTANSITLTDAWVKAAAAGGMTGAFGSLQNTSGTAITVVSAQTSVASMVELHETVTNESGQPVMREVEGGFVIPANGSFDLAPGADHIMLMGLSGALVAGEDVALTLELSDGSTVEVTALVKDYTGANEEYESDDPHAGHGAADHGSADHGAAGHGSAGHDAADHGSADGTPAADDHHAN